jgi:hypothetical protein
MTARERFLRVLNFEKPGDRLPMIEWAHWWDKTVARWQGEGLPTGRGEELFDYFGLDMLECIACGGIQYDKCPPPAYHGAPIITDEASYDAIRPYILNDTLIARFVENAKKLNEQYERGAFGFRLWLDGFFWFPRSLFGIENHFYAFYDYPELMHRINRELAEFDLRALEALLPVLKPDIVNFAEDMSYNHGPMLSRGQFDEFLLPYYKKVIPYIHEQGIKVLVDTDGDLTEMIPWLLEAGADGIFPLERQAGVDIVKIREQFPNLLIMGAYDKMAMSKGEPEMRAEFERLLPVMRAGGFLPGTDHQVPPEVSLENYRIYLKLYAEYCAKAAL